MNRLLHGTAALLIMSCTLSGCAANGPKPAGLSIIYIVTALLALLLLGGCCAVVRKNKGWFLLLFASVSAVNIGYAWLSLSSCLQSALFANRLSYLGSVFLPLAMLVIILNVTGTRYKKRLVTALFVLAAVIFLIAASPGVLDLYYKEVSFQTVNGVSSLVKVYGPLHPLYLIYLLGYFAAMVTVIVRASVKKTVASTTHAVILSMAVFVNIGVWLIEQLVHMEFEMLAVSYIISELFLLGVHLMMRENQRLREMITQGARRDPEALSLAVSEQQRQRFVSGLPTLTPTERSICTAYIDGLSTKEIMQRLCIKENTLKYHNKNIYGKLGVASRKQLLAVHRSLSQ